VALQDDAGLPVVTDGEMRRLSFQSAVTETVRGFVGADLDAFLWGRWLGDDSATQERAPPARLGIVERLHLECSLCQEELVYLRARTGAAPKITLPSPSLFAHFWSPPCAMCRRTRRRCSGW
jgi:5-methyltetrahydropteroyltriglutamate--homocysteine methyltransferase